MDRVWPSEAEFNWWILQEDLVEVYADQHGRTYIMYRGGDEGMTRARNKVREITSGDTKSPLRFLAVHLANYLDFRNITRSETLWVRTSRAKGVREGLERRDLSVVPEQGEAILLHGVFGDQQPYAEGVVVEVHATRQYAMHGNTGLIVWQRNV